MSMILNIIVGAITIAGGLWFIWFVARGTVSAFRSVFKGGK